MKKILSDTPHQENNLPVTKFDIPDINPRIISRHRLVETLVRAVDRRVVLIVAPTGYGKTTLLTEWVATTHTPKARTVWVSIDENDNISSKFWLYIATAFERNYTRFHLNSDLLYMQEKDPLEINLINAIINAISKIPYMMYLVLDDFQWITDQNILNGLAYLIDHQPKNLQIILSSRSLPMLPFARLRARDQLVEITAHDLTFTDIEINLFLSTRMNLNIDDELTGKLLHFTEGWIAGIQLVGLSLQGVSSLHNLIDLNQVSNRQIFEYLTDEVINRQDETTREFLFKTSILTELSAALCDELLDMSDSQKILEQIEESDLFLIPLNEEHTWYRYHTLFAEILYKHLSITQPETVPVLHRRATRWLSENGDPEKAVAHALAVNDLNMAGKILDACAFEAVINFDINQLIHWISHFSDELLYQWPRLWLYSALAKFHFGQYDETDKDLDLLAHIVEQSKPVLSEREITALEWNIASIRASMDCAGRDVKRGIQKALQLRQSPPADDTYFSGQIAVSLAQAYAINGKLQEALEEFQTASDFAFSHNIYMEYSFAQCERAYVLKMMGKLSEAEAMYRELTDYCAKTPLGAEVIAFLYTALVDIAIERNNPIAAAKYMRYINNNSPYINIDSLTWNRKELFLLRTAKFHLYLGMIVQAEKQFEKAKDSYYHNHQALPFLSFELIDFQMRLWAATGKLHKDITAIELQLQSFNPCLEFNPALQISIARVNLIQLNTNAAIEALKNLEIQIQLFQATEYCIEIYILLSLAYEQIHHEGEAYFFLEKAIRLAQPEEYIYKFIIEGHPLEILLEKYQNDRKHRLQYQEKIFVQNLLVAFQKKCDRVDIEHQWQENTQQLELTARVDVTLTQREQEIVRLLNHGSTARDISNELNISINTTRVHIKNIYRKTGVHSRLGLYQQSKK